MSGCAGRGVAWQCRGLPVLVVGDGGAKSLVRDARRLSNTGLAWRFHLENACQCRVKEEWVSWLGWTRRNAWILKRCNKKSANTFISLAVIVTLCVT